MTDLDPNAEAILGRSRQDVIGKDIRETGAFDANDLDRIREAMNDRNPVRSRIFSSRWNRWFSLSVYPARDGVSVFMRDVTEDRRKEENLQRWEAIVSSSEDAIVSKTLDGIVTSWNAAAERLFGYKREEIVGKSISMLMPPEQKQDMSLILGKIRKGERVEHFDTIRMSKSGERIPVSLSVSPVKDPSDRIVGAAKIARDIRERRRAEAEFERLYGEAQEAIRLRDTFLSIAGHEFRTPLAALALTLDTWERRARSEKDETSLLRLATVRRIVDRLVQLTEDLVNVSRIEAGKLNLELERTDLAAIVRDAAERLESSAEENATPLRTSLQTVLGNWDASRIDQVVTNLLTNAIKFGRGSPIDVSVTSHDGMAELKVADHGIGIAPEHHAKIFERFGRAVSDRSYRGMGLGLWIVRELVQAHGGTVDVTSEVGQGATFRVRLPLRMEMEEPLARPDR